jgi:hypothetical protein
MIVNRRQQGGQPHGHVVETNPSVKTNPSVTSDPWAQITGHERAAVIKHAKGVLKDQASKPTVGYGGHLEHKDPAHIAEIHRGIDRSTHFNHPEVARSAYKLHPTVFPNPDR